MPPTGPQADVAESRADVGRLGLGGMVAGVPSIEASKAMEGEAVIGEDGFGGRGGRSRRSGGGDWVQVRCGPTWDRQGINDKESSG